MNSPFLDLDYRWNDKNYSWREISERIFYDLLECVPPARMKYNAFAVGETWKHDQEGNKIHTIGIEVNNRYFMRHALLNSFDSAMYTEEVKRQFQLE